MPVRRWLPQISLRTLILSWMILGGGVAWVAHAYHRYQVEQQVLERLAKNTPAGSVTTITRVRAGQKESTTEGLAFL